MQISDEKTCPRCAENVKAAALVCKHCRHEFETSLQAGPSPNGIGNASGPHAEPEKGKFPFVVGCFSVCAAILVLIVGLGALGHLSNSTGGSSNGASEAEAPPMAITSRDLAAAYAANEVAAQQTYGGKTLYVTGAITGVVLDIVDTPVIHLETANQFLPVQARFDKSYGGRLAVMSKGDQVTVHCNSITSVVSAPMLSDCSLP